jgi:hypothetical protein
MLNELQSMGEEEGEGGHDRGGATVKAAAAVAGYVNYCFGCGSGCCGCHYFLFQLDGQLLLSADERAVVMKTAQAMLMLVLMFMFVPSSIFIDFELAIRGKSGKFALIGYFLSVY